MASVEASGEVRVFEVPDGISDGVFTEDLAKNYDSHEFVPEKNGGSMISSLIKTGFLIGRKNDYLIPRLPAGYRSVKKIREEGREDVYILGHPSGVRFDSWSKFAVHFLFLWDLSNDHAEGECQCANCNRNFTNTGSGIPKPAQKKTSYKLLHSPYRSLIENMNQQDTPGSSSRDLARNAMTFARDAGTGVPVAFDNRNDTSFFGRMQRQHQNDHFEEDFSPDIGLGPEYSPAYASPVQVGDLVHFCQTSKPQTHRQFMGEGVVVKVPDLEDPLCDPIDQDDQDTPTAQHQYSIQLLESGQNVTVVHMRAAHIMPFAALPEHRLTPERCKRYLKILKSGSTGPIKRAFARYPDYLLLTFEWMYIGFDKDVKVNAIVNLMAQDVPSDLRRHFSVGTKFCIRVLELQQVFERLDLMLEMSASDRNAFGKRYIQGHIYADLPCSENQEEIDTRQVSYKDTNFEEDDMSLATPRAILDTSEDWYQIMSKDGKPVRREFGPSKICGQLLNDMHINEIVFKTNLDFNFSYGDCFSIAKRRIEQAGLNIVNPYGPRHYEMIPKTDYEGYAWFESRAEQLGIDSINGQPCSHVSRRQAESQSAVDWARVHADLIDPSILNSNENFQAERGQEKARAANAHVSAHASDSIDPRLAGRNERASAERAQANQTRDRSKGKAPRPSAEEEREFAQMQQNVAHFQQAQTTAREVIEVPDNDGEDEDMFRDEDEGLVVLDDDDEEDAEEDQIMEEATSTIQ